MRRQEPNYGLPVCNDYYCLRSWRFEVAFEGNLPDYENNTNTRQRDRGACMRSLATLLAMLSASSALHVGSLFDKAPSMARVGPMNRTGKPAIREGLGVQMSRRRLVQLAPFLGSAPLAPSAVSASELSVSVEGAPSDLLEITLQPGEKLQADPGTLVYISDGIEFNIQPRGGGAAARGAAAVMLKGGRLFVVEYVNKGNAPAKMALGTKVPSRIVSVKLEDYGGKLLGNLHSFLCAADSVALDTEVDFVGAQPLIFESVTGKGSVFLTGAGNVVKRRLEAGETMRVPLGALVALEGSVKFDRTIVSGGLQNVLFGGQGLLFTVLKGPGTVWVDSAPIDGLVREVSSRLPTKNKNKN